jgi:Protein of unknown function (DUF2829)
MNRYIGTKIINAKPMSRAEYNAFRGWTLPADENGADEGYLVEYTDGGKANTDLYAGYVSWSPKEQFEGAYRKTAGLTFGLALEALKRGAKISRAGWNGKNMWLSLSGPLEVRVIGADQFWSENNKEWARQFGGAMILPCITMKTVNASGREAILMGWLASQTDMLSDDWSIVE